MTVCRVAVNPTVSRPAYGFRGQGPEALDGCKVSTSKTLLDRNFALNPETKHDRRWVTQTLT